MTNQAEHARLPTSRPADIASEDAPVVVTRADGAILYASEGYSSLVGSGSPERTRCIVDRASQVGTAFTYRRLFDAPGGDRLVEVSVHRVADDLLVTATADVTEEEDARDDNRLLGPLPDAVPLGLVVYDRALRIVTVNWTVEVGRVRPEHPRERVTDAFPDIDPAVVGAVEDVLAGGEEVVSLALARPGARRLLLSFFPIGDAHDAVAQVGCVLSTVTAIRKQATPILELGDGVLVAPLVGAMDAARAHELTERVMHAITKSRAQVVILDVAGVPMIDSDVSHELLNSAAVARLMGARVVISGISTRHGEAIPGLGLRTGDIETVATLTDAVAVARLLPALQV